MRVSSLSRWHWVIIALLIGIIGGYVRQSSKDFEDELDSYGTMIPSRNEFERAIVTDISGQRLFRDLTVYPYYLPVRGRNGSARLAHIVQGWYWNGRPEIVGGQPQARYAHAFYLAPVPFAPQGQGEQAPTKSFTILDYLAQLNQSAGVRYRYAWWWWAVTPRGSWLILSVVLIAGVWPTIVNLLAFGSWRRPVSEESFSWRDLWRVRSRSAPRITKAPMTFASSPDEDALAAADNSPVDSEPAMQSTALRTLSGGAAQPAPAAEPKPAKAFGGDKEDFYPTELHGRQTEH